MKITLTEEEYKELKFQEHTRLKQSLIPSMWKEVGVNKWDFDAGWACAKSLYFNLDGRCV